MKTIAYYGKFSENMRQCLDRHCPEGFTTKYVPEGNLAELADASYFVNRGGAVDAAAIAAAPKLQMIQKWGAGYDKIDVAAAGARDIPVSVCIGGNALPVAELTVTLMLDVLRNVVPLAKHLSKGDWARDQFSPRSYLLTGKTVGLVGIGNIARKVAGIVRDGFGCRVLYYDVFRLSEEQEKAMGVAYADLDTLMTESDIISIHVPLLDSTAGMINGEKIAKMKPTACLINTSRGGVVNETDLIEALKTGKILGAGLDTFAAEPLSPDSELLKLENVVTTPHCGGNTVDNDTNMAAICMECIEAYEKTGDRNARSIVNREYFKN